MKINKKIGIAFIIVIVVVNLISLTLMNMLNHNSFNTYITDQESQVVENVERIILSSIAEKGEVNYELLDDYSDRQNIYIMIRNNGNVIYESNLVSQRGMHGMHMMRSNSYLEHTMEVLVDNDTLELTVGQLTQGSQSEAAVQFIRKMNISHVISFIISLIVAVIATIIISNHFSNPIMILNSNLKKISKGNYKDFEDVKSTTYEISELNSSSKQIRNSLTEQEMIRETLVTNLSHDLRTPLTVIKTNLEAMSDGIIEMNKESLEVASDRLQRIISIVKQLDQLKTSDNNYIAEIVNISKETKITIDMFQSMAVEKGVELIMNIEENVELKTKADYYNQITQNLISNAIKYNKPEGSITISLERYKNFVKLRVEDTGIGIKEDEVQYIFDRFYRCDKSRHESESRGIGLSIVKSLVHALGGEIDVTTQYGEGTVFEVKFYMEDN